VRRDDVEAAIADAYRHEWGFVLAATVRVTGDIDVAEECVQDAFGRAVAAWASRGVPERPGAWLTTVARRRAIDVLRHEASRTRAYAVAVASEDVVEEDVRDERLRLIFTCCHPSLAIETQVALALRLLCGLTTSEVARAFLVSETTMAARLTRGKKKIRDARIPFRVPEREELPERLDAVLSAIHLVFTTGYTAPNGSELVRRDLVENARQLAALLHQLLPDESDVAGLLALIWLTDARHEARVDDEGSLALLSEQDRSRWDRAAIAEGQALVRRALAAGSTGRFVLMAAITAVHSEAASWEETDWREIVGLYDILMLTWPSPVVALNRAVAVSFAEGPEAGLLALATLADEPQLANYGYLASARADFLRRLGHRAEARAAYEEALAQQSNDVERSFLRRRLRELEV
jgi:RNA polymerase sigma-70 factor (ECF subfamily)